MTPSTTSTLEAARSPEVQASADDLLNLAAVVAKTGRSSSTIDLWMGQGRFPLGVVIGPRCTRWVRGEVDEWNRARTGQRVQLRPPPTGPKAAASST